MMDNIEHIGIAVKDLTSSEELFRKLLGTPTYKRELVEDEKVNTSFFKIGNSKIELLAPTSEDSAIANFIQKKGEGVHHIAIKVDNIIEEMERLKQEGFILLNEKPKKGADNKLICFVHPKSTNSVLIELCQEIK